MGNQMSNHNGLMTKYIDNGDGTFSQSVHVSAVNIKTAPLVGVKTVGTTSAELFAGSSRLVTRRFMKIYNAGSNPIYYGASGVTTSTGFPIQPGDIETFMISEDVPIYFVASGSTSVNVEER